MSDSDSGAAGTEAVETATVYEPLARGSQSCDAFVLNVMGCRSVQYGSFEDYLVSVTRACRERGMTVAFVYPEEPSEPRFRTEIEQAGGEIRVIRGTESPTLGGGVALWREIRRTRPTVVHGHFGRPGYLSAILGRAGGAPVVLLSKHQTSWPHISFGTRAVYTLLGRLVQGVVVGAEPVREELPSLGVAASKGVLIPFPGIDTSRYRPRPEVRARIREELGVPTGGAVLAAVSHLQERKGLQFLIPAMRSVLTDYPDTVLAVVGDGAERRALEAVAADCRVAGSVRFLGHRADVPDLLAASDIFVCPSMCEGGCAGTLEGMAAGLPVVTTPVGMARDLIACSDSGVVVARSSADALSDGLRRMLGEPEAWSGMGERGREIVARTAEVQIVANELAAMYAEAVSSASRSSR